MSDNGLAVSSCLHKIAINPEVQRRLQTEVDEAWKGHTPTTISELLALKLVRGAFLVCLQGLVPTEAAVPLVSKAVLRYDKLQSW